LKKKKGKSGKSSKKKYGKVAKSTKLSKRCKRIANHSPSSWVETPNYVVTTRGLLNFVNEDGYLTTALNEADRLEATAKGDIATEYVGITSTQFDTREEITDFCKAQCDCECDGICPKCDVFYVSFSSPENRYFCAFYSTAKGDVFKAEVDDTAIQPVPAGWEATWKYLYHREGDEIPPDFAFCDIPPIEDIVAQNFEPTVDFMRYFHPALECLGEAALLCLGCAQEAKLTNTCNNGAENLCSGTFAEVCGAFCGDCVAEATTALLCVMGKKYTLKTPTSKDFGCVNDLIGREPFACPE